MVHCNDWQTALVPVYLRDAGNDLPVVFTIHNVEYQGKYGPETVEDLFGLNRGWYDGGILRMDGCVNLMKAAMLTANAVTTVSPTYARPAPRSGLCLRPGAGGAAHRLQALRRAQRPGHGELSTRPTTAPCPRPTTPTIWRARPCARAELQRQLGLAQEPDTPLTAIVSRLVGHKGMDLVCQGLERHHGHRLPAGGAGPGRVPV